MKGILFVVFCVIATNGFSPSSKAGGRQRPQRPGYPAHGNDIVVSSSSLDLQFSDASKDETQIKPVDDNDDEVEFSKFYRRNPKDLDAESFLFSLSPTKREELEDLLEQVHLARRRKDYVTSDELSTRLRRNFGVRIYNDPPVWTTERGLAPDSYLRRKQNQSTKRSQELYGPKGHPFTQVADIRTSTCPLSVKEINTLLSRHTQAKMKGRYEEADGVLFELRINGVECHTEKHLWRADGKKIGEDARLQQVLSNNAPPVADYKEETTTETPTKESSSMSAKASELIRTRVAQLVNRRADALIVEDVELAQFLLLELGKTYGVTVNDSKRTWSFQSQDSDARNIMSSLPNPNQSLSSKNPTKADMVPPLLFAATKDAVPSVYSSYRSSIRSLPLPDDPSLQRVESLIEERALSREEGKFLEADAIRSELWMTYNIGLNDRLRQWSVGGVFDEA